MKRISLHHEYVLKGTCKDSQLYKMKSRDDLKEKITIQCAKCESAGEVEDEDFNYDYSGINTNKLQ